MKSNTWLFGKCIKIFQSKYTKSYFSILATAKLEEELLIRLKDIIDPGTQKTIQNIGILQRVQVSPQKDAEITLDFIVPGYPFKIKILDEIRYKLNSIPWLKEVTFSYTVAHKIANLNSGAITENQALSKVCHIIAVSSCKGGVGKSTVAVNLAIAMSDKDLKVGILDADVYGPSLPLLLPALDPVVHRSKLNPKHILPLTSLDRPNLKMLSFGHVNPNSGAPGSVAYNGGKTAAVVRGPIVSKIINQLLLSTDWGELDYLIIDMPPGTGDIQITLSQSANLSGAVVITTPHRLSLIDAAKGASMFEDLKVPLLAVVENMSYFVCDLGKIYYPFGKGGRAHLLKGWEQLNSNINNKEANTNQHNTLASCPFHSLPFERSEDDIDKFYESSATILPPIMIKNNNSNTSIATIYNALANDIILEIFKSQVNTLLIPSISYSNSKRVVILRYFTPMQAIELAIPKEELRIRDSKTGKRLQLYINDITKKNEFQDIIPTTFDLKGHYGVAINWSDGYYADIFPYDVLKLIAEEYN